MTFGPDNEASWEFMRFVQKVTKVAGFNVEFYESAEDQLTKGEGPSGLEVKFDRKSRETHRYYIEFAQCSRSLGWRWVPSGLFKEEPTWLWAVGTQELFYVIHRATLSELYFEGVYDIRKCEKDNDTHTRGYCLPMRDMDRKAGWRFVNGKCEYTRRQTAAYKAGYTAIGRFEW